MSAENTDIEQYEPTGDDFNRVGGKLTTFTLGKGGPDYTPLETAFRAVAEDGSIEGELLATTIWGSTEVNLLHVEENARGKGIGKKLLSAAEDFARANGAKGVKIWTPSFQGEGFYERAGYSEVARIPLAMDDHFGGKPQHNILYYKSLNA